ncbi:glycosyltransferase family 2 protein [Synechocystis sp. PCC 7509]|uniref:glycosyltransferase family 2 protein n=1 Tax=Synechocystis sp. PCC 7509 TaxID=927677 RepID=UPI0002AC8105|nr:glycosyltransferase family A protein [Synechocystis sp. PCC 7509]
MLNNNTISIVITCFNEGLLISDAVTSILEQSLLPLEIIIVNDASKNELTISTCKELEQNSLIKVIWRSLNGGTAAARNDGFQAAKGEILVPLDADDVLPKDALKLISTSFAAHPEAGFVYGDYIRQDKPDSHLKIKMKLVSLATMLSSKKFSFSSQWTLIGTTPLKRSLWESIGGYDPDFGNQDLHDVEFWLRALATNCSYYYIPENIYTWRKYLGSNSRRVTLLSWDRIVKKHFDIYCQLGLEYRAYELLLLSSKWLNNKEEVKLYTKRIIGCVRQGKYQLSTLIALAIPTWLLQFLAQRASLRR